MSKSPWGAARAENILHHPDDIGMRGRDRPGAVLRQDMLDAGARQEAVNLLFAKHRLNRDRRSLVFAVSFDIQVKLSDVKVVFSIGALAFEGNLPASIFHMQLIKNDIASWSATSEIVAVLHTNAGHVTLHDTAYNADRNIATGNPYKGSNFRFGASVRRFDAGFPRRQACP